MSEPSAGLKLEKTVVPPVAQPAVVALSRRSLALLVVASFVSGGLGGAAVVAYQAQAQGDHRTKLVVDDLLAKRVSVLNKAGDDAIVLSAGALERNLKNPKAPRATIRVGDSGAHFAVWGVKGEEMVSLASQPYLVGMTVLNKNGTSALTAGKDPTGNHGIHLQDANGQGRLSIGPRAQNEYSIVVWDQAGQTRAVLGELMNEGAGVVVQDKKGRIRAVLGSIGLRTPATGVSSHHPESTLCFFDEKGNVKFLLPPGE